jgi:hypothetical protein
MGSILSVLKNVRTNMKETFYGFNSECKTRHVRRNELLLELPK